MSKDEQVKKNIDLSGELAEYMLKRPGVLENIGDASFIMFSETDETLNKQNEKLLSKLLQEGRNIVKAVKTKSRKNPWIFTHLTPTTL